MDKSKKFSIDFKTESYRDVQYCYTGYCSFDVFASPFSNCQNFTIAHFDNLLTYMNNNDYNDKEKLSLIKSLSLGRRILMIDVEEDYSDQVEEIFAGKEFIVDQPYESSNLSQMHIYYILIGNRDEPEDDDDYYDDDY